MKDAEKNLKEWAKDLGVSEKRVFALDIDLLQAQRIANNLIRNYARFMLQKDIEAINRYLQAMGHTHKRQKITKENCYQIMNIGKAANRSYYKTQRQNKKK
jgi:hypothetical protein